MLGKEDKNHHEEGKDERSYERGDNEFINLFHGYGAKVHLKNKATKYSGPNYNSECTSNVVQRGFG